MNVAAASLSLWMAKDGDLVRIAGQGFQVMPERKGTGSRFVRMPLPEELMNNHPPKSE
jgi:hypothetical protein